MRAYRVRRSYITAQIVQPIHIDDNAPDKLDIEFVIIPVIRDHKTAEFEVKESKRGDEI